MWPVCPQTQKLTPLLLPSPGDLSDAYQPTTHCQKLLTLAMFTALHMPRSKLQNFTRVKAALSSASQSTPETRFGPNLDGALEDKACWVAAPVRAQSWREDQGKKGSYIENSSTQRCMRVATPAFNLIV